MYLSLFVHVGVLCLSLFCYALLCVHSSFAIILKRGRKLVALLFLSYRCVVIINELWLFLTMPWVRLQCVIVVFPDHTHLLFVLASHSFVWKCMAKSTIQLLCHRLHNLSSLFSNDSLFLVSHSIPFWGVTPLDVFFISHLLKANRREPSENYQICYI